MVSKMFAFLLNSYIVSQAVCDYQVSRSKYLFFSYFHALGTATSFYFCHPILHRSKIPAADYMFQL